MKKASYPAKAVFDPFATRARREGWAYPELPSGHDCQAEMPEALCELLLKVGSTAADAKPPAIAPWRPKLSFCSLVPTRTVDRRIELARRLTAPALS
jgi:hypothetical protein